MSKISLLTPVKDVYVNQPFGANYLNFYKQWGLKGHAGIDFRAKTGCSIRAAHDGVISWCGQGKDGGIGIELWDKENSFKTFYYHHLKNGPKIQKGVKVTAGEIVAQADNTGKYTTGDHEHFELYLTDKDGNTINTDNGFNGSVDPSLCFAIGANWDKSNAYHRYGKTRNWLAEYWLRFAPSKENNQWANSGRWIQKQLAKLGLKAPLSGEQVNAIIYGSWDFESVINPAMYELWGWVTKDEYLKGVRPFT